MKARIKKHKRILNGVAVLLRNTTWKCGKWERMIVHSLLKEFRRAKVKRLLEKYGPFNGKIIYRVIEAFESLEERHIIKIEN